MNQNKKQSHRNKYGYIMDYKMPNNIITVWIYFLVFISTSLMGQIPTGETVINSMIAIMSPENSKSIVRQTNYYDNGKTRTFELEMYSADKGEKMMMRYIKPTSVKGQTFLMLNDGDDIWTYFPRTRRVRKMASHAKKMKVQGGDFSFDDFSSNETWENDYQTTNEGTVDKQGSSCWKLRAKAVENADADYPEIVLYVRKDNYYPIHMDYIDEKGKEEKSLYLTNIKMVDDYPTARIITMENHLTGTKTVMENVEVSYIWDPPKGFFSERNLKK